MAHGDRAGFRRVVREFAAGLRDPQVPGSESEEMSGRLQHSGSDNRQSESQGIRVDGTAEEAKDTRWKLTALDDRGSMR